MPNSYSELFVSTVHSNVKYVYFCLVLEKNNFQSLRVINWEIKIFIPSCDLQSSDFLGNVAASKKFMYSAVSNLLDCSVV